MKSLEVSEEKANQRVEEFKREMKTLSVKLKEAEQRAEHAEKQVKRLQKEVDRLEGMFSNNLYYVHIYGRFWKIVKGFLKMFWAFLYSRNIEQLNELLSFN